MQAKFFVKCCVPEYGNIACSEDRRQKSFKKQRSGLLHAQKWLIAHTESSNSLLPSLPPLFFCGNFFKRGLSQNIRKVKGLGTHNPKTPSCWVSQNIKSQNRSFLNQDRTPCVLLQQIVQISARNFLNVIFNVEIMSQQSCHSADESGRNTVIDEEQNDEQVEQDKKEEEELQVTVPQDPSFCEGRKFATLEDTLKAFGEYQENAKVLFSTERSSKKNPALLVQVQTRGKTTQKWPKTSQIEVQ
eukprot:TRINITY_DN7524_c0_g1_i1.p1 TRINITY_DN7524_c0_g1~~TRINITY_DN7524_c0_g1_i1.p1  ORF type:complete len:253 (-),score=-10.71 TRINITY_DN7524_c0_g1_i1:27-758(-)